MADDEQMDEDFQRSVQTWLAQVVLPARFPGVQVPEVRNLKEMHSMLEENMRKWARQEKEEAWREGRQEGAHEMLLSQMEARFGLIPEEVRRSVQEIRDTEELKELGKRLLSAASLSDLRLH
jgi:flagellar biosynthesis/type III secretory pathway protein FliH